MIGLSRLFALVALVFLAGCASAPSAELDADGQRILGTWSGYVTAQDGGRASGGWTFYSDGLVLSSRGKTGRWRVDHDQFYLSWDPSAWGPNTQGPRRIAVNLDGESLTATWTQTNRTVHESYSVTAEFTRLAPPPGLCAPPDASSDEMRHPVLVRTLDAGVEDIRDVRFSNDGARLAVGSNDARVRMYDVASGRLLMQSEVTAGPIWNVAFALDNRRIVSFGPNGGAFGYHLWDPETAEGVLSTDYDAMWNVAESTVAESRDQALRYERGVLYDASRAVVAELPGVGSTRATALFSYDGSALVVHDGYEIRVFNGRTGRPLSQLCGTLNGANEVRISADGAYVATREFGVANSPNVIAVWNVATGAIIARIRAPYSSIWAHDISPDVALLATGSRDGQVRIWRLARGNGPIPLIGPSRTQ